MTEVNGVSLLLALLVEIIMDGERELYKEGGASARRPSLR